MARRKRKRSSCPDPINGFIDLCAGATMAIIARNKLKRDIEKGEGEESLIAGSIVFGHQALRGNPVGLGGMLGLRSALSEMEKHSTPEKYDYQPQVTGLQHSNSPTGTRTPKKYIWREHCSATNGIDPQDYETADDFYDAVAQSSIAPKQEAPLDSSHTVPAEEHKSHADRKYIWRKYCPDGSKYGINPEDFESADDYEECLLAAIEKSQSNDDDSGS